MAFRDGDAGTSYCISPLVQATVIKAAQRTNHIGSTLIYMQLKFHVSRDKPDRRRAEEEWRRSGVKDSKGRELWDTEEKKEQRVEGGGEQQRKSERKRKERKEVVG